MLQSIHQEEVTITMLSDGLLIITFLQMDLITIE